MIIIEKRMKKRIERFMKINLWLNGFWCGIFLMTLFQVLHIEGLLLTSILFIMLLALLIFYIIVLKRRSHEQKCQR